MEGFVISAEYPEKALDHISPVHLVGHVPGKKAILLLHDGEAQGDVIRLFNVTSPLMIPRPRTGPVSHQVWDLSDTDARGRESQNHDQHL